MKKKVCLLLALFIFPISSVAMTISSQPHGILIFFPSNEALQKIKDAKIAWIEMGFDWTIIEPKKGSYNFAEADRVINFADKNGISILAKIAYTASWANKNKGKNYPATNIADWKYYVQTIVKRYKNRVKYWAIWNEPNLRKFFALGKDKYVQQVLLPAAQAIRSTDPSAFIVGPELSHKTETGSEWYFWMKYILDNAGGYFDIISHHIYEDNGVHFLFELLEDGDKLIPAVKTIVQESGQGDKPFWITETGWSTDKYSEAAQSNRYLDMLFYRARKSYPHKLFFYQLIDDPKAGDYFGILHSNLVPKIAYNTYKDYIAGLLPDPGDPEQNKVNKKCYAEQALADESAAVRNPALQSLYRTRDFLRGYSSSANAAVDIYYEMNQEFLELALADSRVFRLGREILKQALAWLPADDWAAMEQPVPGVLWRNIKALVDIISRDYPGSSLAQAARLVAAELDRIAEATPRDLLEYYLREGIRKLGKNR
jgi:hypothetical protein